jgi:hypothetical protein
LMRARPPRWSELVPAFAEHGLILPLGHPGPGSVLGFRPDGRAVVLTSGLSRAADYASAIVIGLAPRRHDRNQGHGETATRSADGLHRNQPDDS